MNYKQIWYITTFYWYCKNLILHRIYFVSLCIIYRIYSDLIIHKIYYSWLLVMKEKNVCSYYCRINNILCVCAYKIDNKILLLTIYNS